MPTNPEVIPVLPTIPPIPAQLAAVSPHTISNIAASMQNLPPDRSSSRLDSGELYKKKSHLNQEENTFLVDSTNVLFTKKGFSLDFLKL